MKTKGNFELISVSEEDGSGKNEGKKFYKSIMKQGKEVWEFFTNEDAYKVIQSLPPLTKLDCEIETTKFMEKTYLRLNTASKIA